MADISSFLKKILSAIYGEDDLDNYPQYCVGV